MPDLSTLQWVIAACTLVGLVLGAVKVAYPRWRRFWDRVNGTFDTLAGREAFTDHTTGRTVEAIQPLGTRLGAIEETLVSVANQQRLLDNHETRLIALEAGTLERIVTKAESAQMWRAVANSEIPDETDEIDPPT